MSFTQTTILLYLVVYVLVSSQLLFYWIVLSDSMKQISMENFIAVRNAIDKIADVRLRILYYSSLTIGLVTLLVTWQNSTTEFFVICTISFLCLLADVAIATKGNIPLNKKISDYLNGKENENWEAVRVRWLRYINVRAIFIALGMVALLIGLILG